MGLIAAIRRAGYAWYWRARHWYMDTQGGREAKIALFVLGCCGVVVQVTRMTVSALTAPAQGTQHAVVWWVVQIIITLVAALIIYATMPKVEAPKPTEGDGPTVEDGRAVPIVDGLYWIDSQFLLAFKVVGRDKIKAKGKK